MPIIKDKETKRRHLIEAAAETFAKKGFHATKMQEVANAASVAKGTLYEYYATKEDLFLAVYDAWINDYEELLTVRLKDADDAVGRADVIRETAVEYYKKHSNQAPLLLEFWAHALRSDNKVFLERVRRLYNVLSGFGEKITENLIEAGVFSPVDSKSIALLEAGISDGIFLLWTILGRSFSLESAYIFRQSLLGCGLLSSEGRSLLEDHLHEKLQKGFLSENI